jgi:excisionase family DNA binding protein
MKTNCVARRLMTPRSDDRGSSSSPEPAHNSGPLLDELRWSMTVRMAMQITGFSKDTIYDLIAAREVESFLMGSRRYLTGSSLHAYIERRAAEPLLVRRSPKPRRGREIGPTDPPAAKA